MSQPTYNLMWDSKTISNDLPEKDGTISAWYKVRPRSDANVDFETHEL